jgi:hypothetical protein
VTFYPTISCLAVPCEEMSERAILYRFSDTAKKMLGAAGRDPPRSYPYNPSLTRFLPWPVESLASNKTMASVDMSFIDFHTPSLPSASSSVRIPASSFEAYIVSTDEHSHNAFDQELVQFDMIYFTSPGLDMHPPSKPCHLELSMEVDLPALSPTTASRRARSPTMTRPLWTSLSRLVGRNSKKWAIKVRTTPHLTVELGQPKADSS